MKNKKMLYIIGGCVVCIVLAIVICIALIPKQDNEKPTESTPTENSTSSVVIDEPANEPQSTEPLNNTDDKIVDDGTGLKPIVEKTDGNNGKSSTTGEKLGETAKPIEIAKPVDSENNDVGITIPGDQPPAYSCGVEGHNCYNAETHAYILNLELEGCKTCGSHSCPSFYAKNQWGYTGYNPEKCPQYDIHKDPLYYCQKCHKKTGDGTNGTCAEYNADIQCPNCKEQVKAWTCHTCK